MPRLDRTSVCLLASLACGFACQVGEAKFPWGEPKPAPVVEHADVHTVNPDYRRTRSQVLVRTVRGPTRAALDYAAYHANFMIADPEPETQIAAGGAADTSHPFAGKIAIGSLTSDFAKLPLSDAERRHPLAYAPLSEFLQARKVVGGQALAEVGAAVREEKWGLNLPPGSAGQILAELYLHTPAAGPAELWAKIEFQPWFTPFSKSSDQDRDGFPEIYGRVSNAGDKALIDAIKDQYEAPILSAKDVKSWANQLASYWYPSFNTDLIPVDSSWPTEQTEPNIKQELAGLHFDAPAIVMRGKPFGKPTYNVFLIATEGAAATTPVSSLKLEKTRPTPKPEPVLQAINRELASQGGGSWEKWAARLSPFRDAVRKRLKSMPRGSKALAGQHGFLFYKNSLEYAAGGDLEAQRRGKNPLPIILEFKKELDQQGVDFLFVPVPTKLDIYPEELGPEVHAPTGQVVNPFFRKFLASLAKEGVEVVDLSPSFLKAKSQTASAAGEPLFQHQDTHWTDRGLRLAAEQLSARVKAYPWYAELYEHAQTFSVHHTSFTRFGDLQSRLPQAEQKNYTPETLAAEQVMRKDGQPYDDDPDSPIVLLGDSFSGVYELTDAEHAGVSAHIARGISYPLDLVMSYGGGPNVRQKLLRRGEAALSDKKLVIWLMTARDLFNYWEDWEPLKKP